MSETPSKAALISKLIPALLGFVVALACAVWGGLRFAHNDSSLLYGLLTGLSFGALFASGQRVRQVLFPESMVRRKKIPVPSTPHLRPALQAAAMTRPLSVEFDALNIRTVRSGIERENIAWQDIERIFITVGDDGQTMPHWLLVKGSGGMRIPNDTIALEDLLEQCKTQLPGYDNDATYQAVINAMGALQGSFEIWSKNTTAAA